MNTTCDFTNMEAQKYWSFPSSYDQKRKKEESMLLIYSDDYVASKKEDGYWEMFIKDETGKLKMRARSKGVNGWVFKEEWVPHFYPFFDSIPNGTVVLGEVYIPGKTSRSITSILGCKKEKAISRQQGSNKLYLSIFDILSYDGEDIHNLSIVERIEYLNKLRPVAAPFDYIKIVEYWDTPDDIHENWLNILAEGGEGVVLTRKDEPYRPGKRTARATLKLKKELQETIDVFLTGRWKEPTKEYTGTSLETWDYWYDEVKEQKIFGALQNEVHLNTMTPVTRLWFNDMAGAVEIATIKDGNITPIGFISGISDEVREGIVKNPDDWKGKVVELQAMEIAYNEGIPALRHAKIINWRTDKSYKDCIWNEEE